MCILRHRQKSHAANLNWVLTCEFVYETCPKIELTLRRTVCTLSEIPGLTEASIQGQWAFGSTRGALLLMAHPRSSYILDDTLLKHLTKVEALKDMFLVTEVFLCPAYSLYLSSGRECSCMLDPILLFIILGDI